MFKVVFVCLILHLPDSELDLTGRGTGTELGLLHTPVPLAGALLRDRARDLSHPGCRLDSQTYKGECKVTTVNIPFNLDFPL